MANPQIIPKKSTVPGKVPTAQDLNLGEFCVNSPDRIIFYRQPDTGNVVTLGGDSGAPISSTPPANPSAGALWIEESSLRVFAFYDNAWVEIVGQKGDKGDKGDTGEAGAAGASAWSDITGKPSTFTPSSHTHTIADTTGLQSALDAKADLVNGLIPAAQLPSYVDDILEYAALANFPATGETGKIYTATGTGKIYRWSGSAYVEISPSPGSTDSVTEGATNLYFTTARASAAAPVQSVAGRTGNVTLTFSDIGGGSPVLKNTGDTTPVNTLRALTQAEYDALTPKDANTIYFIKQ